MNCLLKFVIVVVFVMGLVVLVYVVNLNLEILKVVLLLDENVFELIKCN